MTNKILYLSFDRFEKIKQYIQEDEDCFLVEIYGKECKTADQFYKKISQIMSFPITAKSFDGFFDWIRDLSWIIPSKIVFVIDNFDLFMLQDTKERSYLLTAFHEDILPWWEEEVKQHVIGGLPRKFDVYLVDEDTIVNTEDVPLCSDKTPE